MRKKAIGSSWKMHINSIESGIKLAEDIKTLVSDIEEVDLFILPSFPMIQIISNVFNNSNIKLGAQNIAFEEGGALTGEVPISILKELGCSYIEIGHAERRKYFNETDDIINKKIKLCIKNKLTPIVCIGETKEDLDNSLGRIRIKTQILWAIEGLKNEEVRNIIFAYEPVWAIGQEHAASKEYVRETHKYIREVLKKEVGEEASESIRIIYGGSVSKDNSKELLECEDVDGLFIGRFGLKGENFNQIVRSYFK